jgi:hypothetical protein
MLSVAVLIAVNELGIDMTILTVTLGVVLGATFSGVALGQELRTKAPWRLEVLENRVYFHDTVFTVDRRVAVRARRKGRADKVELRLTAARAEVDHPGTSTPRMEQ